MEKQLLKITNEFNDTLYGYSWNCQTPKANVIIVTGMQETADRYDEFAKFLNAHNFDVYCVDHYGQGLNIKDGYVPGVWPKSGFSKTVKTLGQLETTLQGTNLPIYIFSHSMGSFMAQEYLQRFHDKVSKVVLCGTDYISPFKMFFAYKLAKLFVPEKEFNEECPKMAKYITGKYAESVPNRKTDFDWLSYNEENVQKYIADPKCGFTATGGFYREFIKGMRRIGKRKFMKKVRKTMGILIVGGAEDPVGHMGKGPTKLAAIYKKIGIDDTTLKIYPNMRHEILNEQNNKIVYKDILEFLER